MYIYIGFYAANFSICHISDFHFTMPTATSSLLTEKTDDELISQFRKVQARLYKQCIRALIQYSRHYIFIHIPYIQSPTGGTINQGNHRALVILSRTTAGSNLGWKII